MLKRKILIICLLISICTFHSFTVFAEESIPNIRNPQELQKFVDTFFQQNLKTNHVPGAVISIVKDGKIQLMRGYGYADLEKKIPVIADKTVFRVGSIAKNLTATAVMQLVEQGKLDLHKDVNHYLTDLKMENGFQEPITLHHLLTHTAGLDEWVYDVQAMNPNQQKTLAEYLSHSQPHPIRPPGQEAQYSNHGFGIVGRILEETTGRSFEEYMQEFLLQPLNMKQTSFTLKDQLVPYLVKSYQYIGDKHESIPYTYPHILSAGFLHTNAPDMSNYMIAHLQNGKGEDTRIFSEQTAKWMQTTHFTKHPKLPGIAYGFFESEQNGIRTIFHDGIIEESTSMIYLAPDQNLGIFISTNGGGGNSLINEFISQFFDHYYPTKTKIQPASFKTKLEELKQFDGAFAPNRYPHHRFGKFMKFMGEELLVTALDDGKISVKNGSSGTEKQFIEIDSGLFQEINGDGDGRIYLTKTTDGEKLFTGDPMAFDKLEWYERGYLAKYYFFGASISFILTGLLFIFGWLIRKWRKKTSHSIVSKFRWLACTMCLLNGIFIVITLQAVSNLAFGLPSWYVHFVCSLPFVLFILAIGLFGLLWKIMRYIESIWIRSVYCTLVILGLTYPPFLYYWNFLSIHYPL
ncbi:serine hydrolase [Risungbinella massiliensis]|uniref:serine hydrolase n=1 Tax=Risungbinella massiliensis TaxID=1329796 RepID=UPI0005CC7478|nr:serine hydrolase [Risungbinella massiliensis]